MKIAHVQKLYVWSWELANKATEDKFRLVRLQNKRK